ncbi:MAG: methyl-accepting chemotaxis protein [Methylocystaceae bacterium]
MKFKTKLILIVSGLMVVFLSSISVLGYYSSQKVLVEQINQNMSLLVERHALEMDNWLVAKSITVGAAGSTLTNTGASGVVDAKILQYFKNEQGFSDMYIGFANRSFISGTGWIPPADYVPSSRGWYKTAIEKNKLTFSDPYLDMTTNQFVVAAVAPFKDSTGNACGVIGADIPLAALIDQSNKLSFNGVGHAILIDNNGYILSHPNKKLVSKEGLKEPTVKDTIGKIMGKDHGQFVTDDNGVDSILVFKKLPSTNWVLAIEAPKNVLFAPLRTAKITYIIFDIIGILIATLIALLIANKITKPMTEFTKKALEIAAGDLTVQVKVTGTDEIAETSNAFNHMSEGLRNLAIKIQGTSTLLNSTSKGIQVVSQEAGHTSEQISLTINELANGAGHQAESVQHGAEMIANMEREINLIAENTSKSVVTVDRVQSSVAAGSRAIADQSEIMKENSQATNEVGQSILALDDKSKRIGQIVDLISSIADQTNLLALNAAIEAARAGEQGRGFAVVADEVRKLAEQSAESSHEIARLIQEIQTGASNAVNQMKKAENTVNRQEQAVINAKNHFEQIHNAVQEIVFQIQEIAASAHQLETHAKNASGAISNIAAITEETAASTQEVAASSQEQTASVMEIYSQTEKLVKEAEDLAQIVQSFKI